MKLKPSKDYCLWLVPPNDGRVRKIRLSYFRAFATIGLISAIIFALVAIAGDYTRVQFLRIQHALSMKALENERDRLEASTAKLQDQLAALKSANSEMIAYEKDVKKRLSELSGVIENATKLGVVEEGDDGEPLDSAVGGAESGVGGGEVDCEGIEGMTSACPNMSLAGGDIRAQLNPAAFSTEAYAMATSVRPASDAPAQTDGDLVPIIEKYISFVRSLPLATPANGRISSRYGYRISPFTGTVRMHQGMDISLSTGTTIHAAAGGIVRAAEFSPTYGMMVLVEHSDKIITRYAHLSKLLVREGQKINIGQPVGLAGSTGRSTGPHLHYEVLIDGETQNPKTYIELVSKLRGVL